MEVSVPLNPAPEDFEKDKGADEQTWNKGKPAVDEDAGNSCNDDDNEDKYENYFC